MQHNRHKVKAIGLSILWMVTGLAVYIISLVREAERMQATIDTSSEVDWYELILLFAVFFYFIPLLKRIQNHASLAKMKRITIISQVLIILFSGAALIALFSIVLTVINKV